MLFLLLVASFCTLASFGRSKANQRNTVNSGTGCDIISLLLDYPGDSFVSVLCNMMEVVERKSRPVTSCALAKESWTAIKYQQQQQGIFLLF